VSGSGSGLFPVTGFGIICAEPSGTAITVLVSYVSVSQDQQNKLVLQFLSI